MDAKKFKETYLQWSKVVIIVVACLLNALVLCDHFLGFDFSQNMYMLCFISTGIVLAFLSITWISALNLESRFMKGAGVKVIDDNNEEITLSDIAECIKKEGYMPDVKEDDNSVFFKIQGEAYRVHYKDCRFSMYKYYQVGENTKVELLKKAAVPTEEQVFGMKVFVTSHDEGHSIIFQFSSLFKSVKELQVHFPRCLNILDQGINFHRDRYAELEGEGEVVGVETLGEKQAEHKVFS